jgi:glycosyltransferase involved in cell wall biosynthesis
MVSEQMHTDDARLRVQIVAKPGSSATGIGRYALGLERGLRAEGVELRHAEIRSPAPRLLRRVASRMGYDVDAFARTYPLRADVRPGYLTHLATQTLATLFFVQRLPRPVVVTLHDILPYLLRDDPALRVYRHRLDRWMDALAMRGLRRADLLLANSEYTRQTAIDALGIPPERIEVVYHAIDHAVFKPQPVPQSFRDKYGLPPDRPYVLFVGSEDPRKNLPLLLRALAIVRRSVADVVLLKVGAAAFLDQRERNVRLAEELGIADVVRWIDLVPEADVPLFYNAASVLAFPSLYEGFGLPTLEATACGTPVVAGRVSSLPELVGDVVPLLDELAPEPFAAAIAAAISGGRRNVDALILNARRFTWERTIRGTEESYRRVLAERAARLAPTRAP